MYVYAVLLAIGFFGIIGMASAGFLHFGHGSHSGVRHGHGPGHAIRAGHTFPLPGHAPAGPHGSFARSARTSLKSILSLSPLDLFSYCAGAGVAGLLFYTSVRKPYLPLIAVVGALAFDLCFTRLIANTIQRFSANPSAGLEGMVAQNGVAETAFDTSGQGLIKLSLDGQIVQMLAVLEEDERESGVKVKRGDPLLVVQVDASRNRCIVTRELAQAPMELSS